MQKLLVAYNHCYRNFMLQQQCFFGGYVAEIVQCKYTYNYYFFSGCY